jgi:hypothetical protein
MLRFSVRKRVQITYGFVQHLDELSTRRLLLVLGASRSTRSKPNGTATKCAQASSRAQFRSENGPRYDCHFPAPARERLQRRTGDHHAAVRAELNCASYCAVVRPDEMESGASLAGMPVQTAGAAATAKLASISTGVILVRRADSVIRAGSVDRRQPEPSSRYSVRNESRCRAPAPPPEILRAQN